MTGLLVSVRDAAEAEVAVAAGAALIDVKEPARGALGRADDATIAAVVDAVAGRCWVSAAMGELGDDAPPPHAPVQFLKWGLAGMQARNWRAELRQRFQQVTSRGVVVAYADWQCAQAPAVDDVVSFACEQPGSVLLVDTHCKDASRLNRQRKPTLLDWLSVDEVFDVCRRCHGAGVRIALAGSLGTAEIEALLPAQPDWIAVRGAVCEGQARDGRVEVARVTSIAKLIRSRVHFPPVIHRR